MSDMTETKLAELVSRSTSDPEFKARLKSDPAAVFADYGIEVPEGVRVHVVENTENDVYFALPASLPGGDEIPDAELEAVAGGAAAGGAPTHRPILALRSSFLLNTRDPNIDTCGKSCGIPW